jgi:NAD(P)H-dependent flavin oxidoreductase YrpB (nitropropane dioxygenase family)
MGAYISSAHLANCTSRLGALGVVSGVGLRQIVISQIKQGDTDALDIASTFPVKSCLEELMKYAPGGEKADRAIPVDVPDPEKCHAPRQLSAICAYVEVIRAKRGHTGLVGINVMWKLAATALPTIYGALLAGVDALLCGAGVPMELPDIVAKMRSGSDLEYRPLTGTGTNTALEIAGDGTADLLSTQKWPWLLPILSNYAFCKRLLDTWQSRYNAEPTAFILENHAAGGHNAPPRNHEAYGEADDLDGYFDRVLQLGRPVYVAGDFASGGNSADLAYWQQRGAAGIQVGSRFALCADSGMRPDLRDRVIAANQQDALEVSTDMRMSPTGYPMKFASLTGTLSDPVVKASQRHVCNLGYLVKSAIQTLPDGRERETYVCPAMPEEQYRRLGGGSVEQQEGKICLCNALLSTAGFNSSDEPALVTLGESGRLVKELLTARQVVEDILGTEQATVNEAATRL